MIFKSWRFFAFVSVLLFSCSNVSAKVQIQKFIYVINAQGSLLRPSNAASQCPDFNDSSLLAQPCNAVLVDEDGNYSMSLPAQTQADALLLVANSYSVNLDANKPRYVLLESKRRGGKLNGTSENNGWDINNLSEGVVNTIERSIASDSSRKTVAEALQQVDIKAINRALANASEDNYDADPDRFLESERVALAKQRLTVEDQPMLQELIDAAVENQGNRDNLARIRHAMQQILPQPEATEAISQQVFNHIAATERNPGKPELFLEADHYLVYPGEPVQLTTANSLNPQLFFAYVWDGVESLTSSASFSRDAAGGYLVCATGEADNPQDSSSDCVRLAVRAQVQAIARASRLRVGGGNTLKLSATLSLGATQYAWSGAGSFSDSQAEQSVWTAPLTAGQYPIDLSINNGASSDSLTIEVFGVEPVAVAEANPSVVYIGAQGASVDLNSGSISNDGSPVDSITWEVISKPAGANAVIANAAAAQTSISTDTWGDYVVLHSVEKNGIVKSVEVPFQVRRVDQPYAEAGPDITGYRNQDVLLDGSGSYAAAGETLSYLWNSGSASVSDSTQAQAKFRAAALGSYQVDLSVSAPSGSDSDSVTINVVNQVPVAAPDVVANLLNQVLYGQAVAYDLDGDSLQYELLTQPVNGGVTMNPDNGAYVYVPGGVKGCKYHPYSKPTSNFKGGKDVPVIKLCADRYVAAVGETINLTTSNSINASKFSGYTWGSGIVGDSNDITKATFLATQAGYQELCIVGNIGASNNTSTACVTVLIGGGSIDDNAESGYIETFTYRVADGYDTSPASEIKITIGWENSVPVADNMSVNTDEEVAVSGNLSATDADGHAVTYRIVENGSLGSLVLNDASTGAFTYTPVKDAFGSDTITYVANDGLQDSAVATLTVNIANINDAPVAFFTGSITLAEDTSANAQLGGQDVDGDALDYRLAFIPGHGVIGNINAQTGAVTYVPDADYFGSDSFAFVVHDGQLESNWVWVNVNVTPVNDKPVAASIDTLYVDQGSSITFKVSGSDVDGDALTFRNSDTPSKGGLQLLNPATGEFRYTPTDPEVGADSFHFVVEDGLLSSDPGTVSLEILPVGYVVAGPLPDHIEVFESVNYGGQLQGSDSNGAPLSFNIEQQGNKGKISLNSADGTYVYQPYPGLTGDDQFSFSVSNGKRSSNPHTVKVSIIPAAISCQGPGQVRNDQDGDGYSSLTEWLLNSSDVVDTAYPDSAAIAGLSFNGDRDNDSFSDIAEYWLGTDYNNASDIPTLSTLKLLPNCLTALYDSLPPVLQAFYIESPLDISNGNGQLPASFRIAVLDNASGVSGLSLVLRSPSGQIVKLKHKVVDNRILFNDIIHSDPFNRYAEEGIWLVDNMQISDARGNIAEFSTQDLLAGQFPVQLQVINTNADAQPPQLSALSVQIDPLDLAGAPLPQQFAISASDNVSGIEHIELLLLSPNGAQQVLHASADYSNGPVSLNAELINSDMFQAYHLGGSWTIHEVTLRDRAQNVSHYSHADLLADASMDAGFDVIAAPPVVQLSLDSFKILTPTLYLDVRENALFELSFNSNLGLQSAALSARCNGQELAADNSYSASTPLNISMHVPGGVIPLGQSSVTCSVNELYLIDQAGNQAVYSAADLTAGNFATEFTVVREQPRCDALLMPAVYDPERGMHSTLEDTAYSDKLWGKPHESCSYEIINKPRLGTLNLNVDSGAYTYTPNANANADLNGEDVFTFRLSNGISSSSPQNVSVHIIPVDDVPTVEDLDLTVLKDASMVALLKGSDPDGEALSFNTISLPQHGDLLSFNTLSGQFVYQPHSGFTGVDSFQYTLGNSASTSAAGTVTINVRDDLIDFNVLTKEVNGAQQYVWVKVNTTLLRDIGSIEAAQVTLQGPDGSEYVLNTFPNATSYPLEIANKLNTTATPLVTGVWHFVDLKIKLNNSASFQLVMADLGQRFDNSMTVINDVVPTIVSPTTITTGLSHSIQGTLLCNDPDSGSLTYAIDSNPNNGTFVVNESTGAYTFTPSKVGSDVFKWHCSDSHSSSAIANTLVEVITDQPPVCKSQSFVVAQSGNPANLLALVQQLYGYQAGGESLSYHALTQPSKGSLSVDSSGGSFVYRPQQYDITPDSFSYKVVADNIGLESPACTIDLFSQPVVHGDPDSLLVLKNQVYNGQLHASGGDGSALSYSIGASPQYGSVDIQSNGSFNYTPNTDVTGLDSFTFVARDQSGNESQPAIISLTIVDDPCLFAANLDQDGDGYIDYLEQMLGSDPNNANDIPSDLTALDFNQYAKLDNDADGVVDYHELWLGSDAMSVDSKPSLYYSACFNTLSDGIRPQLAALAINTPSLDLDQGQNNVRLTVAMLDNASGLRRLRINVRSPSGTYQTASVSFDNAPLLTTQVVEVGPFPQFAEAGEWTISSMTLFDYAGNRLDLSDQEIGAMVDNRITVINQQADAQAPSLAGFSAGSGIVYPGTLQGYFNVQVHASDALSGVRSVRVDFLSPSGYMVSASKTLDTPSADVVVDLSSDLLSQYAEDGIWTVFGVMLVDDAGNSAQYATELAALNYPDTIQVTNPSSDINSPWLQSISAVASQINPGSGDTRMGFVVSLADDLSGVARIEIEVQGPSDQLLLINGVFDPTTSVAQTIESAPLNSLTETGIWRVQTITVWDDAGNSRLYLPDELQGFNLTVEIVNCGCQ